MTWPEIWNGNSFPARVIRIALIPVSLLYALGWWAYLLFYRLGIKKPARPHSPVICVGNLVVGGSGKTPIVVYLARLLDSMGYRVVISASGYGSPSSEAARVAPEGPLDPKQWGDEPALLRKELPLVPLIVGRRRVLAAELCHREFPGAVLLLDDGMQHLPLARDLSFIVEPPGRNRFCLPAGPYREASRNPIGRGEVVFVPGPTVSAEYSALEFSPRKPERAALLCALGNPQGFLDSVRASGVDVAFENIRSDHDPLDAPDLWSDMPDLPVVVSLKDWVKLQGRALPREVILATRTARLVPEEQVVKMLRRICG